VCMHDYTYVCIYECWYRCVYEHMHTHTHTHTQTQAYLNVRTKDLSSTFMQQKRPKFMQQKRPKFMQIWGSFAEIWSSHPHKRTSM